MRIIILRHGKRYGSPLFETSLTPEGLQQAKELVGQLGKNRIDDIYSSPFPRVLQTIYPFCEKYGCKVNIENSFYEALKSDEFTYANYKHEVSELYGKYPEFKGIIEMYESKLNIANISHVERDIDINNRVSPFIWKLIEKYKNTDKCILIATHQTICNAIKKYFDNSVNYRDTFPQGTFEIIDVSENMQSPASIVYEHLEHNRNAP
jgi:broad specificity phosphatase PhoE